MKHEPIDLGDSSTTSEFLMMDGASVVMQEQRHQQDLSSHHEHEQRSQQVENDDDKLQMMQTDEDPLLQETINALMSGSGGIEVVSGVGVSDEIDNERNYECNFCGKLFTRSNTLSYHLKVHNDEKPYKCGSCDKAFREQYRLTKHQRTHTRDLAGGIQQQDQEAEQSQDSSFPSNSGRTAEDEDYTTGDSERFFRNYELQEDTAVMKLEPDISLTVDGASTNQSPSSANSDNDVRYQIVEERIKSLQREVHLVNQNLNRVETKLDGLTKIIAIFINKFEEVDSQPNVASDSSAMISMPMISVPIGNLQPHPTAVSVSQPQSQPQTPVPSQAIQMITTHHQAAPMATTVTVQTSPSIQQQQQPAQQGQLDNSSFIGGLEAAVAAVTNNLGSAVAQQTTTIYSSNNDTFPEVPELPIRTVNDFLDLNDHCTDNEQFLLQMVSIRIPTLDLFTSTVFRM